jgi:hypothetical protein
LHHRQFGRRLALENAGNVAAGLPIGVGQARAVAHQAAGRDKLGQGIARRQRMARRQRDQPVPLRVKEPAAADEQRTRPALEDGCKGRFLRRRFRR